MIISTSWTPGQDWPSPTPIYNNIKDLSLQCAKFSGQEALLEVFASFPRLERLYCQLPFSRQQHEKIIRAIKHVKPPLLDLTISASNREADAEEARNQSTVSFLPISSLKDCQTMRRLSIHARMLIGPNPDTTEEEGTCLIVPAKQKIVDALPASIEKLVLVNCEDNSELPAQLSALVSQKASNFPSLKKLNIEWERPRYQNTPPYEPVKYPGFTKKEALQLLADCEKVAVEMVMTPFWGPRPLPPWFEQKRLEREAKKRVEAEFIGDSH